MPCAPQFNVLLIAFFNWYYTFLQLEPKDLAEQLKRQVPSLPQSDSRCSWGTLWQQPWVAAVSVAPALQHSCVTFACTGRIHPSSAARPQNSRVHH